jgi:CBS domain-containing protein
MNVQELMTTDPEACAPRDTLNVSGEIMRRRRCGFVPVVDSQATKQVIGVLTDRDIALYLTRTDAQATQVQVEACMTKEPKTISPEAELEEAARIMEQHAVHRLPVVENGRLVGILSLKDIARAARKEWAGTGPRRAEQQMVDIIEAIAAAQTARKS